MLRVHVPEEQMSMAGPYILAAVGSPAFLAARNAFGKALYDFQCDTSLSFREREAVRMWVAYFLSCNVCKAGRPATQAIPGRPPSAADAATVSEEFYDNIPSYRSWSGYSDRERLAIEFVERFATDLDGIRDDEAFWTQLKKNFSETEIGDLGVLTGCWVPGAQILKMFGFEGSVCEIARLKETAQSAARMA
jgi:alkylhydroperoxidase family enzyme